MHKSSPSDPDLRAQAKPGYGVPSQDPSSEAQVMFDDLERSQEFTSSLSGTGLLTGAAIVASAGGLVAGTDGLVFGGLLGACSGMWLGLTIASRLLKTSSSLLTT